MYCKECGEKFVNETSSVCLKCGTQKGNGNNYCNTCGEQKKCEKQDVCLNCGKNFKKISFSPNSVKTKLIALLFWFFLGAFGAHLFYVGKISKGILYLCLTLGGLITFGITAIVVAILLIIDLVKILTDKFEDANGVALTQWV